MKKAHIRPQYSTKVKTDAQTKPLAAKSATGVDTNGGNDEILAQISALTVRIACLEEERKQTRKALCEMLDATEDLILKMAEKYDLKFSGISSISAFNELKKRFGARNTKDTSVTEFYQSLKKQCKKCTECKHCPFVEFCYLFPKDMDEAILSRAISALTQV